MLSWTWHCLYCRKSGKCAAAFISPEIQKTLIVKLPFKNFSILKCSLFLKAEFLAAITPVFSVTWFFRNHADLVLKKHFLPSMLKTVVLLKCVMVSTTKKKTVFFCWIESSIEQPKTFCNINVFTVPVNQFNEISNFSMFLRVFDTTVWCCLELLLDKMWRNIYLFEIYLKAMCSCCNLPSVWFIVGPYEIRFIFS